MSGVPRDLRLVPATLAGSTVTWWSVASEVRPVVVVAAGAGVTVLLLVAVRAVLLRRLSAPPPVVRASLGQLVLVGAVVMVLSLVVAAQLKAGSTGLLPGLVGAGASGTVRGSVVSEPRTTSAGCDGEPRVVRTIALTTVTGWSGGVLSTGPAHGDAVVLGGTALADVDYGASVEVDGRLLAVDPGSATTAMLALREATPSSPALRVLEPPGPLLRAVGTVRSSFVDVSSTLPEQARGLVPGVAVGDTSMLSPRLDAAMKTTSLTHVTAVSGSHFAIIFATVSGLCTLVRLPRRVRVVVAGLAMAGFVLLVHPEPSVVRAAAMSAVALVAVLLGRPGQALSALCAAVLVLLAVDPFLVRSYGFVLSALGTAGLVVGTRPIAAWLGRALPRWMALAVAVPLAAQLACAPVIVLLDPVVATYAVPANVLAAPALVPATVLGVVGALLAPWWPGAAGLFAQVAGWATWWIAEVAERLAGAPLASIPWAAGAPGAVLLAVVSAAAVVLVWRWSSIVWTARTGMFVAGIGAPPSAPRSGRATTFFARLGTGVSRGTGAVHAAARPLARAASLLTCALVGLLVVWQTQPPWLADVLRGGGAAWDADWQVVVCDVGQGDALVVQTGPGRAVMVDVGPPGDAAARCLDELGVTTLDLLVLTHFHDDHVGGLAEVLDGRVVEEAYVSPVREPAGHAEGVARLLDDASIPWQAVSAETDGVELLAGPAPERVVWGVLAPAAGGAEGRAAGQPSTGTAEDGAANDGSVVMVIRTPDLSVVALGDLEASGQAALLRSLTEDGVSLEPVDVVKMAHHGSRAQDPDLARLLSPDVVLVGVGADNTYGHPTQDALDLYESHGATILRTDLCSTSGVLVREGQTLVAEGCS